MDREKAEGSVVRLNSPIDFVFTQTTTILESPMSTHLNATFPGVMRDRLSAVRTRRTAFAAVRAMAIALTILLVAMLVSMLIDWGVTLFDVRYRVLLSTTTLLCGLVALLWSGWRPVRRALGWTTAAEQVDQHVPQMEERWLTVASMTGTGSERKNPATQAMLARVTSEAVAMSRLVRPERVVSGQFLRRPMLGLGTAILALGVFFTSHWGQTSVLWQRFWSPTHNITATQIQAVTGDAFVPRGQSLTIAAKMAGLKRDSVDLIVCHESQPDQEERLAVTPSSSSDGSIVFPIDVDETLHYRIQAGDGRTEWHTLTAIDFPELKDVRLTITPPKYVDEAVSEKTLIPSRLRAVQGSQLELAIRPQIDLKSLTLRIAVPAESLQVTANEELSKQTGESVNVLVLNRGDDGWYRFETSLVSSFSMTPLLVSGHDLKNRNPRVCHVEVVEDHAPVARIISPNGESSASLDEVLDIRFEAHDDHGIATAKLVVYEDNPTDPANPKILAEREIPLGDQSMQKHVMGNFELDLKELGLEAGRNISYAVRVTDNRDLEVNASSPLNQLLASMDERETREEGDERSKGQSSSAEMPSTEVSSESTSSASPDTVEKKKADQNSASSPMADPDSSGGEKSAASSEFASTDEPSGDGTSEKKPTGEASPEGDKEGAADADSALAKADIGGKKNRGDQAEGTAQKNLQGSSATESTDSDSNTSKVGTTSKTKTSNKNTAKSSEQANDHPAKELMAVAPSGDPSDGQPMVPPGSEAQDPGKLSASAVASNTKGDPNAENSRDQPSEEAMPPSDATAQPGKNDTGKTAPGDKAKLTSASEKAISEVPQGGPQPTGKISLVGEQDPPAPTDPANSPASDQQQNPSNSSPQIANAKSPSGQPSPGSPSKEPPPTVNLRLNPQMTDSGQQQETERRRLRITSRLDAVAASDDPRREQTKSARGKVVQIDKMLEVIEGKLHALHRKEVDESQRGKGFQELDLLLKGVEDFITQLDESTRETSFEFVGLQMVDIAGSHVTPARDAVFIAIRTPDSGADVPTEEALHHVVSARELLESLLKRYDKVAQEQQLAQELDKAIKMYTVYVERSQQLMREAQQNLDPLKMEREMEVVEVDQTYLDRLAEVTRMRRDMMSELARILADDPRLLSRYLDLIKRRRSSLSNQLAELAARQDQTAQEVLGWISVDDNQRANYWLQVSDLRLDAPNHLAKEAQQLADRVEKQLPLVLDPAVGAAAKAIAAAKQIALNARRCDLDVQELRKAGETVANSAALSGSAESLIHQVGDLAAALDRIELEAVGLDGVTEYVQLRRIEVQTFADLADTWSITARAVEQQKFSALADLDQHQLAVATELLRTEMRDIDADLAEEFNEEVKLPQEVINLTQDLQRTMESITHNQASATFALVEERMNDAASQQALTLEGFEKAQDILNRLRRKTAESLDKIMPVNPNVAELVDPTLDEFLASLEREPNIEAQLGIPGRPRNIRILQDAMSWSQNGAQLLGSSGDSAMARMQKMIDKREQLAEGHDDPQKPNEKAKDTKEKDDPKQMTDDEKQQLADSKEVQKMLKERMAQDQKELERQANDPSKSAEQRRKLAEMAKQMGQSLKEMEKGQTPEQLWRQMAEADQAKAILEALAKGEQIPDEQWNKLLSTLGDGVGQVAGRVPSEDYRKSIEQYQERIRKLSGSR